MDGTSNGFDGDGFCTYVPNIFVLHTHKIRDWLPFFFLYEEICDSATDFVADYSPILLSEEFTNACLET